MAIKEIKLPDGTVLELDEWLHWPTYSVMEFSAAAVNAAALNLFAFTYVQGQQVSSQGVARRTATEADTNQAIKGQTNYDEALLLYSITYEPFALSAATISGDQVSTVAPVPMLSGTDLHRLQRDLVVELLVGAKISKPQFRSPFAFIGQGPGSPGFTSGDQVTGGSHFQYGTGGRVSAQNQRLWKLPVYIASQRVMKLKVFSQSAITDLRQSVRLRWYLDGLKRRPVG